MNALDRGRSAAYTQALLLVGAATAAGLFMPLRMDPIVQAILGTASSTIALVVGTLGLVRYRARRDTAYLVLGVGFVGTGLLEVGCELAVVHWMRPYLGSPAELTLPWCWYMAHLFLAVVLLAFWRVWVTEAKEGTSRVDEWMVYAAVAVLATAGWVALVTLPLPPAYFDLGPIGRPQELVVALIMGTALYGLLRAGAWRSDTLHHWLILGLVLSVGAQVSMALSTHPLDGPFLVAHGLKVSGYACVLIGFMGSIYQLQRRAEADANRADLARAAADAAHASSLRRAAELEASEGRYRALVEGAAVALWDEDLTELCERLERISSGVEDIRSYLLSNPELITDLARDIRVLAVSDETLRMFAADSTEELFASWDRVVTDQYSSVFVEELVAIAQGADHFEGEASMHTLDGRPIWVSKRVRISTDRTGRVRAIMSLTDVTDIKRTEGDLRARTNELARSNAELDDFAYIASHDLKEPLRGMANFAHFLLEDHGDQLDDAAREKVETLIRISTRMERLIQSLLEYSKVARTEPNPEMVDLNAVLAEVLDSIQGMPGMAETDVRVSRELPVASVDRGLTSRIFHNLITNAIKYNDKDDRWVEIGWFDEGSGARREQPTAPVFYVKDNGVGIRDKHIESIFRIFKRLHARDQYGGGAGVGLTIVKKIVEAQGGRIWVDSEYGRGASVYFTLGPAARWSQPEVTPNTAVASA